MTGVKTRRALRLESLESRELLSSGGPSAQEQYMLELINLARTNPSQVADRISTSLDANDKATIKAYGTDINLELNSIRSSTPKPPLAWNSTLAQTARGQSQYQADNGIQTHSGPNGMNLEQRLDSAGYTDRAADGENAYAYANSVDHAMKAFLVDWGVESRGHRGNLLQPNTSPGHMYDEVGIGIVGTNPGSKVGPFVMTQDFGRKQGSQAELVGVVFDDRDGDHFYTPGEGRGGVSIEVDDSAGQKVAETTTWDSGGYQIPLAPGSYKVTASVDDQVVRSQGVTIGSDNVKVDYDLSQPWQGGTASAVSARMQATVQDQTQPVTLALASTSTPDVTPTAQAPVIQLASGPIVPNLDASWLTSWTWWRKA